MPTTRIDANIVIIGDGSYIKDGSVVFENGKITYAGEQEHAPNADLNLDTPVLMPGLWESHAHYTGITKANISAIGETPQPVLIARATWDVRETIASGVTSVREVGGFGVYLKTAVEEGFLPGPRIYGAGSVISQTGGHGDYHTLPLDIVHLMNERSMSLGELADGVGECYRAVRKQLRKGAEIIKYCASGGVMSIVDHPVHQQFSPEEHRAIVEEATRAELGVAAHCHGAPGIRAALEAGVTTIDHGTFLDEDLAEMMVEKNAILVPTLYVVRRLIQFSKELELPEYALVKAKAIVERHKEAVRIAIRTGVTIAMGTDIFASGPNGIFQWGQNAYELQYLVDSGMSISDAIVAATGNGPLTLGPHAPKSGMLKKGYDADLLLLRKNPLEDISILTDRANIKSVIRNGKTVANNTPGEKL